VAAESGVLFLEAFDQVVVDLMISDRGYERLLSRNQRPAMTISRDLSLKAMGNRTH